MDKSKLFTVYNRARGAAHQGTLDAGRVNRALGIAQSKVYRGRESYVTTLAQCTCPDHQYRHVICKHMIAKMIKIKMKKSNAESY